MKAVKGAGNRVRRGVTVQVGDDVRRQELSRCWDPFRVIDGVVPLEPLAERFRVADQVHRIDVSSRLAARTDERQDRTWGHALARLRLRADPHGQVGRMGLIGLAPPQPPTERIQRSGIGPFRGVHRLNEYEKVVTNVSFDTYGWFAE